MTSAPILEALGSFSIGVTGRDDHFLHVRDFSLPAPGVYTLEGPNGSGKSMLLKLLTGTLPGTIGPSEKITIRIDGKEATIRNYREATTAGVGALFQDDDLIPTMTVLEYLELAHSTAKPSQFIHYLWDVGFNILSPPILAGTRLFGPEVSEKFNRCVSQLEPRKIDWRDRKALRLRAENLLSSHNVPTAVLDAIPTRLSGGARAAAKLVGVQLYKNMRVIFLDEAFNSVEKNVWPRFQDSIKQWARANSAAIVAVSHNPEELWRWDPVKRFEIRDRELIGTDSHKFGFRRRSRTSQSTSSDIFEVSSDSDAYKAEVYGALWAKLKPTHVAVVSQSHPRSEKAAAEIERFLPAGVDPIRLQVSDAELEPEPGALENLLTKLQEIPRSKRLCYVLVGDRALRSLTSFALHLNAVHESSGVVACPTSFSDLVTATTGGEIETWWKRLSAIAGTQKLIRAKGVLAPNAYLLLPEILNAADFGDTSYGLAKCLRLGLVFDAELYAAAKACLVSSAPSTEMIRSVFTRSIAVMNDVSEFGPLRPSLVRLSNMGTIHSDCIRSLTAQTENRDTIILGMMIDAALCEQVRVVNELGALFRDAGGRLPPVIVDGSKWDEFERLYEASGEIQGTGDGRKVLASSVSEIGEFQLGRIREQFSRTMDRNRDVGDFADRLAEQRARFCAFYNLRTVIPQVRIACGSD